MSDPTFEEARERLSDVEMIGATLTPDEARSIGHRIAELEAFLIARMNKLMAESHAVGQSSKCDGCAEATAIHTVLGGSSG